MSRVSWHVLGAVADLPSVHGSESPSAGAGAAVIRLSAVEDEVFKLSASVILC